MRKALLCASVLVLAVAALTGCAGMSNKAPVDQKAQVKAIMDQWSQAIKAKNVDGVVATLSPTFSSSEFGDYAEFKDNITGFIDEGNLDNAEVDMTNAEIVVEDGKATVYPVEVSGGFGSATLRFQLVLEDDNWRIVSFEQA